ncbi:hypothetical protein [Rhabdochlamydiaceae symbiont of Dictyostelium giganteum]|uniref:hypothetical protein n=1 Tax=Rhabdochlamydiaceae symbiont of Dictyostelium giganteum TaxID=3342349 RepID=UPI00384C91D7
MKSAERQKMCLNCDGRIPYESSQCPYCFAPIQMEGDMKPFSSSREDPLAALYNPPYPSKPLSPSEGISLPSEEPVQESKEEGMSFSSTAMLVVGSNLFTVGLLQFFFSEQGILHLEMNASYWFLMLIISLPLIYFGLKSPNK